MSAEFAFKRVWAIVGSGVFLKHMFQFLANRRAVSQEIMDSPDIQEFDHVQALVGLRRINRISGSAGRMLRPIMDMARRNRLDRFSLLDVACGGGDVPIAVALGARQLGIQIDLVLVDRSPTAVAQAAAAAARAGIASRAVEADALNSSLIPCADVVTNSLFLHHLREPDEVIGLLRRMCELSRRMVLISDLRRCRLGHAAAWAGCRLLSGSWIVHHDAPASARAAWTLGELSCLAEKAGMTRVRIVRCRPWRMLLAWEKPPMDMT